MNTGASFGPARTVIVFALLAIASQAQAADRRFMPVPQGSTQTIQVINGMPILSAVGKQFQAATSVSTLNAKHGRLLVSIKNQGSAAMTLVPQAVVATAAGQVLSLREATEAAPTGLSSRDCNGISGDEYARCLNDNFNRRAEARSAPVNKAKAVPAARVLQPGEVFATQYYLELPRKKRGELGAVLVTVELAGERLSFDFKEVE